MNVSHQLMIPFFRANLIKSTMFLKQSFSPAADSGDAESAKPDAAEAAESDGEDVQAESGEAEVHTEEEPKAAVSEGMLCVARGR